MKSTTLWPGRKRILSVPASFSALGRRGASPVALWLDAAADPAHPDQSGASIAPPRSPHMYLPVVLHAGALKSSAARHLSVALALALLGSSCAVHLRTPDPDLVDRTPVRPAGEPSSIAAVARLSHDSLARLVEQQTAKAQGGQEQIGMLAATWQLQRDGRVLARSDDRGRLCFTLPFAGKGAVAALGQRFERDLKAQVSVCALPQLDNSGSLRLKDPDARVLIDRSTIGGPLAVLVDAVAAKLQSVAGQEAVDRLRALSVPTADFLTPLLETLNQPLMLPRDGCLKLRPLSVWLAQPAVDPTALRLGAAVQALPTVEQPCVRDTAPAAVRRARPPVAVTDNLQQPKTFLLLPMGLALDGLAGQVQASVDQLGKMETAQGWMQVGKVKLSTSRGALLVRAQVTGELRDKLLFIPITRKIQGEVVLWGVPELTRDGIGLANLSLDVQSDDTLVDLGASLRRTTLVAAVQSRLRIPREKIEGEARNALANLGPGVDVAGQKLPIRVETEQLTLEQVAASGQRLDVIVKFVGHIIVGDTARR